MLAFCKKVKKHKSIASQKDYILFYKMVEARVISFVKQN